MTAEYLLSSIGRIDDALVAEAAAPPRRHTAPWLRWGALAAAAALCVGLVSLRPLLMRKGAPAVEIVPAPAVENSSAPAEETEARAFGTPEAAPPATGAPSAVSDVMRPVFFWNGSAYHLVDPFEDILPDGCVSLGVLVPYPSAALKEDGDSDADTPRVIVNEERLVGHAVWQAEDGDLFIAVDGGYARARMSLPER